MSAKRLHFIMLGLMALIIIGGSVGFYFANSKLKILVSQITEKKEDIEVANAKLEQIAKLKKELQDIESIKPDIDTALPKGKSQEEIVAQIVTIATRSGLPVQEIAFEETSGLPSETSQTKTSVASVNVSAVPVTIRYGSMPYTQLKAFLADLFNIRRNANVTELKIQRENSGNVNGEIVIELHFEKAAGSPDKTQEKK